MFASKAFIPLIKDNPQDAEIVSHKLMLRAGLIRKVASGIYNWLPLGYKAIKIIESIVREEMDNIGSQEMFMPMVQPKNLWEDSNRWDKFGPELLRIKDRHDREFCLGPTHEEIITDLIRNNLTSYKNLPMILYQIQTKFRDEIRPRYGVMRGREFLMKDAYSFHMNKESLNSSYKDMRDAYSKILGRLGLDFRIVKADSGSIGGDESEEFHVLAENGEDTLAISNESDVVINAEMLIKDGQDLNSLKGSSFPDGGKIDLIKGIEVGHIFQLGQIYSKQMKANLQDAMGGSVDLFMGCYGVGISRMVAACIEQSHDQKGIIWPNQLAPIQINIILTSNNKEDRSYKFGLDLYEKLRKKNNRVMLDERDERFGKKITESELLGVPVNVVIGKSFEKDKNLELIPRAGKKSFVKDSEILSYLSKLFQ